MLNSLQLGPPLPACACAAMAGLPAPAPLGLVGFAPAPDLVRRTRLLQAAAAAQCRAHTPARFDDRLQTHWVVRNRVLGFSDLLAAYIMPNGPDHATLVLYCRSVYGHSDPGVSLACLRTWPGALDASLPMSTER